MHSAARLVPVSGLLFTFACASTAAAPESVAPRESAPTEDGTPAQKTPASTSAVPGGPGASAGGGIAALSGAMEADRTPCIRCTIDLNGRFRGQFRSDVDTCGDLGAKFNYPLKKPVIQVLRGEQAGQYFVVGDPETPITLDQVIDVNLGDQVKPEGWRDAIIWVTDSTNLPCASSLYILRE